MDDTVDTFLHHQAERVDKYRTVIENLLADYDSYHYAEATLISLLNFMDEHDTITDGQVQAIENIQANPSIPK